MMRLTKVRVPLLLIALAVVLLAASGCAKTASTGAPAATTTAATAPPTIEIAAPLDGAKVAAGDVNISVKTTGLKFTMPSNTNVPGEGHVHFTLDDTPFKMSVTPDYVYTGVSAGTHKLKAELVQNDTKSFDPPVEQEITFVAE